MADEANDGVIPESKIREAHAKCMQDPALARYFEDAPPGAKQYIALMFYCTVFQAEVDDEKCVAYQAEVEADLTKDDLLYLATHERNLESKAHFRELYVEMVNAERSAAPAPAPSTAGDGAAVVRELVRMEAALARVEGELARCRAAIPQPAAPRGLVVAALTVFLVGCACALAVAAAFVVFAFR